MGVLVAVAVLLFYFSTSSLTGPPTFDRFEGGGPAPDVIPPISNVQKPLCSSQKDGRTQDGKFHWGCLTPRYTVWNLKSLPTGTFQSNIPTIQATPRPETPADREIRLQRREAVKGNFTHAWKGYKEHAWLHDEVRPQTGSAFDPFGGWAATLVDALGEIHEPCIAS
jgi:mannosyl-oligosaccharide alpha-1,2-mannosidase